MNMSKNDHIVKKDLGMDVVTFLDFDEEKIREAAGRGYTIPSNASKDRPSQKNNWNGPQTPYDHARKLYDLWNGLMDGNIPFGIHQQKMTHYTL
jgi:hypothetical protein